jgi:hypothetical protein
MLRAIAALLLLSAVALGACGGGDDEDDDRPDTRRGPSLAEWRLETRGLCRDHSERLLAGVKRLPESRKAAERFERRILRRERKFLARLARVEVPRQDRIGFRNAIRDRRKAVTARLKDRDAEARSATARAVATLERKNLLDCAGSGAYGVEGGTSYASDRDRQCRRRLRGLRRAAKRVRSLPVGEAKLTAGLAFARRVQAFGRRPPIDALVPEAVEDLERRAFREVRVAGKALRDTLLAARRIDRPAFNRARARFRRSAFRGSAAWWVLNIPSCEKLYEVRAT